MITLNSESAKKNQSKISYWIKKILAIDFNRIRSNFHHDETYLDSLADGVSTGAQLRSIKLQIMFFWIYRNNKNENEKKVSMRTWLLNKKRNCVRVFLFLMFKIKEKEEKLFFESEFWNLSLMFSNLLMKLQIWKICKMVEQIQIRY